MAQNPHGIFNRAELTLSAVDHRKEPEQKEACPGTSSDAGDNVPKGEIDSILRQNMSESQQLHV